jgi:hypothetical protein
MPKPWICWKAPPKVPKTETSKEVTVTADSERNEQLKKFLQFKALQTKCHQRQAPKWKQWSWGEALGSKIL